jgi:tRNA pseudouridine synthase 10
MTLLLSEVRFALCTCCDHYSDSRRVTFLGRYIKLSREYSQTPWSVRGQRLTEFSVSESIGEPLKKYFRCDDYKFVTAGREDANVRMLGHGRPFYMQMVNPRQPEVADEMYINMEDEINHSSNSEAVLVRHLARIQP